MKRIIFLRHGQTINNQSEVAQGFLSPLNLEGLEQASAVVQRFKDSGAEIIFSSNMIRARDTARVLGRALEIPVIQTGYLRERLRPTEQSNLSHNSEEFKLIERNILQNFELPDYRFSDEENFEDLKYRSRQIFKIFLESNYHCAIAVTHKNFMYYLTAFGMFGEELTREQAFVFITKLHIDNTGMVEFVNQDESPNGWVLHRWNDHAHVENKH